jgi:uncharacterized membrane protein
MALVIFITFLSHEFFITVARFLANYPQGGEIMNSFEKGIVIASAVATLIAGGSLVARAAEKAGGEKVRCAGINECKGHGSCAGAEHSCAGQNACKGQGWVETSAEECTQKGGKIIEAKK